MIKGVSSGMGILNLPHWNPAHLNFGIVCQRSHSNQGYTDGGLEFTKGTGGRMRGGLFRNWSWAEKPWVTVRTRYKRITWYHAQRRRAEGMKLENGQKHQRSDDNAVW